MPIPLTHPQQYSYLNNMTCHACNVLLKFNDLLFKLLLVTIINNILSLSFRNGGAIVVAGRQSPAMQLYNPQCFLQYENSTLPPTMWNVS